MHQLVMEKVREVKEKEQVVRRELEEQLAMAQQHTDQTKIQVENVCTQGVSAFYMYLHPLLPLTLTCT